MTHAHLNFYNKIDGKKYYVCSVHICHDGFDKVIMPVLKSAFDLCEKKRRGTKTSGHLVTISYGRNRLKEKHFNNWFSAEVLAFNFCALWGSDDGAMLFNEEESDASYRYEIVNHPAEEKIEITLNGYSAFKKIWRRDADNK